MEGSKMGRESSTIKAKPTAKTRGQNLSQIDYEQLAEFRYLLRRFLVFSETAAEGGGLTAQQHQALLAIKGHRGPAPLTIGRLAERLAIQPHSAVGLIDRLAAKGLVRRCEGTGDRRQVVIEATQEAEKVLGRLSVAHRDELRRLAPLLRDLLDEFDKN
jgi:DNA-binding MarR family transcriptional regulator